MSRNIPNKPHPTPNPDQAHTGAVPDRASRARSVSESHASPGQTPLPIEDPTRSEPVYDSCFDDLNVLLSQSMQQPDPDPNLGDPQDPARSRAESRAPKGPAPRTSEIFRAVVVAEAPGSPVQCVQDRPDLEVAESEVGSLPDLDVTGQRAPLGDDRGEDEPRTDVHIPWTQVVVLSYSSALTLAMIWMFVTGRILRPDTPATAFAEPPAAEAPLLPLASQLEPSPPPIPSENLATIGTAVQLGDLEVTPTAIEVAPVELVRTLDPPSTRRETDCLLLRLQFVNRSSQYTFAPMDLNLVRERDLRAFDPYITTSGGERIRLFPLALDSEWSIRGQEFPVLRPGESGQTFVASEPGSASRLADGMTWRVRLRTGIYRVDMLGVKFNRSQIRRPDSTTWNDHQASLGYPRGQGPAGRAQKADGCSWRSVRRVVRTRTARGRAT